MTEEKPCTTTQSSDENLRLSFSSLCVHSAILFNGTFKPEPEAVEAGVDVRSSSSQSDLSMPRT